MLNNPLAVDLVATVRLTYCLLASLAPPWEYLLASYGRWKASQGGKSGLLGIYETSGKPLGHLRPSLLARENLSAISVRRSSLGRL